MSIAENISVNGVKVPMALSLSFLTLLLQWDFFGSIRTPPNRSDGTNCTEKKQAKPKLISSCTNKTNGKGIVKHLPKFAQNQ
jgi:hypothetical protein